MNPARRNAVSGAPPSLVRPSAVTTTSATADASVTAASSITRTPPLWAGARRRVTSRARVVLPTPPGPTIVTSCRRSTIPATPPVVVTAQQAVTGRRDYRSLRRRGGCVEGIALGLP